MPRQTFIDSSWNMIKDAELDFLAVFPEYENFLKECKQYAK